MSSQRFNLTRTDDFAGEGAVAQGGGKRIHRCDCGAEVVWVKSARTGRNYLAHTFRYANRDGRYYIGGSVHTVERHERNIADRAAWIAAEEAKTPAARRATMIDGAREWCDEQAARPWNAGEATDLVVAVLRIVHLADVLYPAA